MSHTHPFKRYVNKNILPEDMTGLTVLDCGCGRGNWAFFMRTEKAGIPHVTGFDLYGPYVEKLKRLDLYEELFQLDIRDVETLEKKFDIIMAMDVLEHIEKDEALKVIKTLEEMSESLLIVSLPIGFQRQGIGDDGNPFQVHLSGFTQREMRALGYETKNFMRFTRTINFVQRVRCFLLGLSFDRGRFIAWKRFK